MMKHILLIFVSITISLNIYSQYDLQSSLYSNNKFLINPANTGDKDIPYFLLGYRYNFTGIVGSLRRSMFGVHSPISDQMGLGGLLSMEQLGIFQYYSIAGSYSYSVTLSKDKYLHFGISSGLYSRSVNRSKVKVDESDDNILETDYYSNMYYFTGTGIELEWTDLCVDISLPKLYAGEDKSFVAEAVSGLSYNFHYKEGLFTPSVYMHYWKHNPVRFDLNLFYQMPDEYFLLLSLKSDKSGSIGGGINIKNLNISYVYELNTALVPASKGTHEVLLSYALNHLKDKKNKQIRLRRYGN